MLSDTTGGCNYKGGEKEASQTCFSGTVQEEAGNFTMLLSIMFGIHQIEHKTTTQLSSNWK